MTPDDYRVWEFWLQAGAVALSVLNSACLVVLWLGGRHRITREAIDRVEANAKTLHAEQEERLIRLEEKMRHALVATDLSDLYNLIKQTEKGVAALSSDIRSVAESQRDLNRLIMQRGIEK